MGEAGQISNHEVTRTVSSSPWPVLQQIWMRSQPGPSMPSLNSTNLVVPSISARKGYVSYDFRSCPVPQATPLLPSGRRTSSWRFHLFDRRPQAPMLKGARPSNPKWLLQRPPGMVPRIYGCHTAHYRLVCAIEEKPITLKRVFSMELGNVTFPLVR